MKQMCCNFIPIFLDWHVWPLYSLVFLHGYRTWNSGHHISFFIRRAKATVISYLRRVMDSRLLFPFTFLQRALAVNVRECVQRTGKAPSTRNPIGKNSHFMRKSVFDSSFYSNLTKWNKNNLLLVPSFMWSAFGFFAKINGHRTTYTYWEQ